MRATLGSALMLSLILGGCADGCGGGCQGARRAPDSRYRPHVESGKVVGIAVAGNHSCAMLREGRVACWGSNFANQLTGSKRKHGVARASPMELLGLPPVVQLSAGELHTCGMTSGKKIVCWGANEMGQLGQPRTLSEMPGFHEVSVEADALVNGWAATCVTRGAKAPLCWGRPRGGPVGPTMHLPVAVAGVADAVALSLSSAHGCAVRLDGTVSCWGSNDFSELGSPGGSRAEAALVMEMHDVMQVGAGFGFNCVLKRDRNVWCWGKGEQGQLGAGDVELPRTTTHGTPYSPKPLRVLIDDVVQIDVGGSHSCAVKRDGSLLCWGANDEGQLGDGSKADRDAPSLVEDLDEVVQVACGSATSRAHTCALRRNGEVWCWGYNHDGQLGDGSTEGSKIPIPVQF